MVRPQHGGVVGECRVEHRDVVVGRALLAAVHLRRALGPGERVVDVAREDEVDLAQAGVEPGQVGRREIGEPTAAGADGLAVRVQEACAERGQHARPAVRGRAAPDAEHDGPRARFEGGEQQLTGAVRGGRERGEHARRQMLEAGGLGHLDHRGGVAHRVGRGHGVAERPGHPRLAALESGGHRGRHRAVAPVRHGQGLDPYPGGYAPQPGRHPLRDLHGRERALELVRRDEHACGLHHCSVRHLDSLCFRTGSRAAPTLTAAPPPSPWVSGPWTRYCAPPLRF